MLSAGNIPGFQTSHGNLPPIPHDMAEMMDAKRVYIRNVGPKSYDRPYGTLGRFSIPACPEGERYSAAVEFQGKPGIPTIIPTIEVKNVERNGMRATVEYERQFTTDGHAVAKDVVGTSAFRDPSDNLTQFGVFICAGPVPTEAEIEGAEAKLNDHYDKLVKQADRAYEVDGGMEVSDDGKKYSAITASHVQAAKALGLDRPWARKNVKQIPCEACGMPVAQNAVRCSHAGCGAILNEEKARKMFPHLYAHEEEVKRGPGRPRKTKEN